MYRSLKTPPIFSADTNYTGDGHPSYGLDTVLGVALESPVITDPIYAPPGNNQAKNKVCYFEGSGTGFDNIQINLMYGHSFPGTIFAGTEILGTTYNNCLNKTYVADGLFRKKYYSNRTYTVNFGIAISPDHMFRRHSVLITLILIAV